MAAPRLRSDRAHTTIRPVRSAPPPPGPAIVRFCGARLPQPAQRIVPTARSRPGETACRPRHRPRRACRLDCTPTRKTLCPAAIMSLDWQPNPIHPLVVDERAVGASQVAQLALRRIDLNHEVIARQRHVLRHRAMHEPRPPDDERVVTVEDELLGLSAGLPVHPESHASYRSAGFSAFSRLRCGFQAPQAQPRAGAHTVSARPSLRGCNVFYVLDANIVALADKKRPRNLAGRCNQSNCKRAIKHDRAEPRRRPQIDTEMTGRRTPRFHVRQSQD